MHCSKTIFGLLVFLSLSTCSFAQAASSQSAGEDVNAGAGGVATLTTTDLLSVLDVAPKSTPATRSRIVGKLKNGRLAVSPLVAQTTVRSVPADERSVAVDGFAQPVADAAAGSGISTGVTRIDELVTGAALRNGVDRRLILAVMRQESSFNPRAVSYKGARGLMQLMPATAMRFGVRDIFDPAQNIEGGARYLRFLLDTFSGDVELALAGYNAGENAVLRFGSRVPPYRETQDYVRKISAHYLRLTNGTYIKRELTGGEIARKPVDIGFLTNGQTMTQF